jgi:putative membrane protein
VIGTCRSLISFGFGLDRIIGAINSSCFQGSDHTGLSVRQGSIGFVLDGILAMATATRQHLSTLRLIRRDDFVHVAGVLVTTTIVTLMFSLGLGLGLEPYRFLLLRDRPPSSGACCWEPVC